MENRRWPFPAFGAADQTFRQIPRGSVYCTAGTRQYLLALDDLGIRFENCSVAPFRRSPANGEREQQHDRSKKRFYEMSQSTLPMAAGL